MTQPTPLQTLAESHEATGETIKGARFIGRAVPLQVHDASRGVTDAVALARSDDDDALHHGWAYRAGPDPADFGWSDDGEPVGSAGASVLRRIDAANLRNVIVIVSRWGGSQRLSAGDLGKGYAAAARSVLATAKVTTFVPTTLEVPWSRVTAVRDAKGWKAFGFFFDRVTIEYVHDERLREFRLQPRALGKDELLAAARAHGKLVGASESDLFG